MQYLQTIYGTEYYTNVFNKNKRKLNKWCFNLIKISNILFYEKLIK